MSRRKVSDESGARERLAQKARELESSWEHADKLPPPELPLQRGGLDPDRLDERGQKHGRQPRARTGSTAHFDVPRGWEWQSVEFGLATGERYHRLAKRFGNDFTDGQALLASRLLNEAGIGTDVPNELRDRWRQLDGEPQLSPKQEEEVREAVRAYIESHSLPDPYSTEVDIAFRQSLGWLRRMGPVAQEYWRNPLIRKALSELNMAFERHCVVDLENELSHAARLKAEASLGDYVTRRGQDARVSEYWSAPALLNYLQGCARLHAMDLPPHVTLERLRWAIDAVTLGGGGRKASLSPREAAYTVFFPERLPERAAQHQRDRIRRDRKKAGTTGNRSKGKPTKQTRRHKR